MCTSFLVCRSKTFTKSPYVFNECRNIGLTPFVTYLNFTHGLKKPSKKCRNKLSYHVERMNAECIKTDTCNLPLIHFNNYGCDINKTHTLFAEYACVSHTSVFNKSNVVWDLPPKKDVRVCKEPGFSPYFLTNSGYPEIGNPYGWRWIKVTFPGRVVSVTVLTCRITVTFTHCNSTSNEEFLCDERNIYKKEFYCQDYVRFTYYNTEKNYHGFLFQLQGK